MFATESLWSIFNIIPELLGGAIMMGIGTLWGRWKSIQVWRTKKFEDRVVLGLNTLHREGDKQKLLLRTIFETDLYELLQDKTMVKIVKKAIKASTEDNPLLIFPEDEAWYVLNATLNQIISHFTQGTLKKDMGIPVTSQLYTFCFTFEKEGGIRMQKVRVLLIQKNLLKNFPDNHDIVLEQEKHTTRLQTLRTLKQQLTENPHCFMDVEICQ